MIDDDVLFRDSMQIHPESRFQKTVFIHPDQNDAKRALTQVGVSPCGRSRRSI